MIFFFLRLSRTLRFVFVFLLCSHWATEAYSTGFFRFGLELLLLRLCHFRCGSAVLIRRLWIFQYWFIISLFAFRPIWFGFLFHLLCLLLSALVWHSLSPLGHWGLLHWSFQVWFGIASSSPIPFLVWFGGVYSLNLTFKYWFNISFFLAFGPIRVDLGYSFFFASCLSALVWYSSSFATGPFWIGLSFLLLFLSVSSLVYQCFLLDSAPSNFGLACSSPPDHSGLVWFFLWTIQTWFGLAHLFLWHTWCSLTLPLLCFRTILCLWRYARRMLSHLS